ncbi:hypothetical protein [Streptomyces albireticuli]|uniref:Lipoprotein n=1 Tax=Streptomyces albireticuli TaxID=1940 RepID=A0A2A2D285_9ACTN|nr:hypothetical protein [Streptomyces albireticuli]MCD9145686.1 hypothetical protein [Streptomyces albireticuli]MCD9165582.1 hypothetical protein [Streptomyces albireticuli]MCD9195895.1 hypothetical protein [Streptomyces albireticuli]PAU46598.1 hypothetical protein CK936_23280 [Streptomyces albireticuli]
MTGRWIGVVLAAAAVCAASGCAAVSERRDAATAATAHFEKALRARRYAAACAVLAPTTREELARSARVTCEEAMGQEEVPAGGAVRHVDVYGNQARAVLTRDTVFLSRFPGGWKVTAAGCQERPEKPYRCGIKGG